ncbi:glucan biosynthesis protein [Actibacterium sp. 188UL27-1]|uniref:glucan biosynthesis protein n=1 Tax=Actibacterium sp. 188UL27-1 TaxID=2786961 RepID=UPI00195B5052|nr:glucan biosynthesis protein G [Actibacterium sp. 188UL27-1]MBM7068767.1 glucan biosynthesis protein [Actibacterium sp. 188UL27-1]
MTIDRSADARRRTVLKYLLGTAGAAALSTSPVLAQTATEPSAPVAVEETGQPAFSFDLLKAMMRDKASQPDAEPEPLDSFAAELDYDGYRNIRSRPDGARWSDTDLAFQLHPFHPGWLYSTPIRLHEVIDGRAHEMMFSTDDFEYMNGLDAQIPEHEVLPGIAGLRVNHPLNRADLMDELVVFQGASYFRALGRANSYGLSARGLALNTWLEGPEEFPRFSEFWVERPAHGQQHLVVYAAMDSPSLTGAYRFEIHPGADTVVDVEAEIFFREDIKQLGLAPLTSMFFYSEHSERDFDDYRPQVHDSDALRIVRGDGDVLLRPLNNPSRVAGSYFAESDLRAFGLIQRDRAYEDYQDAGARYHDRPSVMVEPLEDWGPGAVRLVEIPAELEIDDNIVLFWVPDQAPVAGEAKTFRYRMHWGALSPNPEDEMAWISSTRAGHGGPAGVPITNPNLRKFVVDFRGGLLGASPEDTEFEPVISASAGKIDNVVLFKVPESENLAEVGTGIWRLVIDIDGGDEELIELSAHVAGYGRKLTEIWLYQWVRDLPTEEAVSDTTEQAQSN